ADADALRTAGVRHQLGQESRGRLAIVGEGALDQGDRATEHRPIAAANPRDESFVRERRFHPSGPPPSELLAMASKIRLAASVSTVPGPKIAATPIASRVA